MIYNVVDELIRIHVKSTFAEGDREHIFPLYRLLHRHVQAAEEADLAFFTDKDRRASMVPRHYATNRSQRNVTDPATSVTYNVSASKLKWTLADLW